MIRLHILLILTILCSFFTLSNKVYCKTQLLDRILVQINTEIYTQWQMEVHFVVKRALFSPKENPITTQTNWKKNVEEFIVDMSNIQILKKKGLKIAEIDPIKKDQFEVVFENHKLKNKKLKERIQQLGINQSILYETLKKINLLTQWGSLLKQNSTKKKTYDSQLKNIKNTAKIIRFEKKFKKIRNI